MQTRYETLLDEIHANKRELSTYRQKYLSLENQLINLQQENRNQRKTILSLKQSNEKLFDQNKTLVSEKQIIFQQYKAIVESIKGQIDKKQQEIYTLKENNFSPFIDQKLFEKQIRTSIQSQYEERLEVKQKKNRELLQQIEKVNFEKTIEKEKYNLKIEALEKNLKQAQNSHLLQLQNYVSITDQSSKSTKKSDDQSLIKKLKREIDELRLGLDLVNQQLNESIAEKARIQKDYNGLIASHQDHIEEITEKMRDMQIESKKNINESNRFKIDRDLQNALRQKEKQTKNLKNQLQQIHQTLTKKDQKISKMQILITQKENQIQKIKEFNTKSESEITELFKQEKLSYKKELVELKNANQTLRKQVHQLISSRPSSDKIKVQADKQIQPYENDYQNPKTTTKQIDPSRKKRQEDSPDQNEYEGFQRIQSEKNLRNQNSNLVFKKSYLNQCKRNQELSQKYVNLKKRHKILQEKFNQANSKLIGLLKQKIQLGTSPQKFSKIPEPELVHAKSHSNFNSIIKDYHYFTEVPILKDKKNEQSMGKTTGEQSFYEKSLKIKNSHKFKDIICLNHCDSEPNHAACSHSLSPLK